MVLAQKQKYRSMEQDRKPWVGREREGDMDTESGRETKEWGAQKRKRDGTD